MAHWHDLNKFVELTPQEATAYRNRAAVEVLLKEYEKALADASKAIELDGNDGFSYRFAGRPKLCSKTFMTHSWILTRSLN